MKTYKNITIKKNSYKVDGTQQPDRLLQVPTDKKDKNGKDTWVTIAKGWVKDSNYTNNEGKLVSEKYISAKMNDTFVKDNGEVLDGYLIISESDFNKMSKVYEDHLISLREPDYPTPTKVGIDIDKVLVPDITPEELDNWPADMM